jgi:hypothetical protein
MDSEKLITHARARFDHAAAKRTLREKYQAKLVFAHGGGMFRSSPELMVFLQLYSGQSVVLLDLYENPVKVDADELLATARERWQEQMTAWLLDYDELGRKR